jgi:hypothetical protein
MSAEPESALSNAVRKLTSEALYTVRVDEVMSVCTEIGLVLRSLPHCRQEVAQALIELHRRVSESGSPLAQIMVYEIANVIRADDSEGAIPVIS